MSTTNNTSSLFKLRSNVATFKTLEARACANGDIAVFDVKSHLVQKTKHLDPNNNESESSSSNNNSLSSSSSSSSSSISRQTFLPFLYNESENAHSSMISGASFSLDGSVIATTSEDMMTKIWGVTHGELRGTLKAPGVLYSVAFVPGGRYLMASCHGGMSLMFSTVSGRVKAVLQGGHGKETSILCCCASDDMKFLATGSQDGSLCIWKCDQLVSNNNSNTTNGNDHSNSNNVPTSNSTANFNASSSQNNQPSPITNSNNTELKFTLFAVLDEHTDSVFSCKFIPSNKDDNNNKHQLVTGGADGNLILWSVEDKSIIKKNNIKAGTIFSVAVHPKIHDKENKNSKLFCIGTEAGAVAYVNSETLQRFEVSKASNQPIASVDFHPDGQLLASGCEDGKIVLWNVDTREAVASLPGHKGAVYACSFSPVGEFLVTAGEDKTLRVWNVRGGKNLSRFKGCKSSCGIFAERYEFGDEGQTLVAVGADEKPVCKWSVDTGKVCFIRDDIEEYKKQQEELDRKAEEAAAEKQREKQQPPPTVPSSASGKTIISRSGSEAQNLDQKQHSSSNASTSVNSPVTSPRNHQNMNMPNNNQSGNNLISQAAPPQALAMLQSLQQQVQMLDQERKDLSGKLQTAQAENKKITTKFDESMKEQTEMIQSLMKEKEALTKKSEELDTAKTTAEEKAQEEREKRTSLRRTARDDIYNLETQKIELSKTVKELSKQISEMKQQNQLHFDQWTKHLEGTETEEREYLEGEFQQLVAKTIMDQLRKTDYEATQLGMSLEAHRHIHMGTLLNIEEMEETVESTKKEMENLRKKMKDSEEKSNQMLQETIRDRSEGFDERETALKNCLEKWQQQLLEFEDLERSRIYSGAIDDGTGTLLSANFAQLFDQMTIRNSKLEEGVKPIQEALKKEQKAHIDTNEDLTRTETALGFSQKVVKDLRDLESKQAIEIKNLSATAESQIALRQADVSKMTALEEQVDDLTRTLTQIRKESAKEIETLKSNLESLKRGHVIDVSSLNQEKIELQQQMHQQKTQAQEEMEKVKSRISEFEQELASLGTALSTAEEENKKKDEKIEEQRKENQEVSQKLAQAVSFGLVLKQKIDILKETGEEKEKSISEERQRTAELQKEVHATNSACRSRIEELQVSHNTALNNEIQKQRDLLSRTENAEKQERKTKEELDKALREKQHFEKVLWQVESDKTDLQKELADVKKKEQELSSSLSKELTKRQSAESLVDSVRRDAQGDSQKSVASFTAAEKKAQDAENLRQEMERKLTESVSNGVTLTNSLNSMTNEMQLLESKIENLVQEKEQMKSESEQAIRQQKQSHHEELSQFQVQLDQLKSEKEALSSELQEVKIHGSKIYEALKTEKQKRETAEADLVKQIQELSLEKQSKEIDVIQEFEQKVSVLDEEIAELEEKLSVAKLHGTKLVESLKKETLKREQLEKDREDVEDRLRKATQHGTKIVEAHRQESRKRMEAEERIRSLEDKLKNIR